VREVEDARKNMGLENVPRCQHVKINGTQCGSPALRRRRHCFFHDRIRREQANIRAHASAKPAFELPLLEDANCVQVALMKVIQMLASGLMDHKTAGLILYALQTASVNLRHADFEVDEVSDIVIDRDTVSATCINGPQWYEEDFDDEDDEVAGEEEYEDEEAHDKKSAATAAQSKPVSSAKKPAKALNAEQARTQVRGVVQNWLSKKGVQNATVKPAKSQAPAG
jgi:hypothetical protein